VRLSVRDRAQRCFAGAGLVADALCSQAGAGAAVESSLVANNRGRGVVLRSSSSSLQRSVVWGPKFWGVVVRAPGRLPGP